MSTPSLFDDLDSTPSRPQSPRPDPTSPTASPLPAGEGQGEGPLPDCRAALGEAEPNTSGELVGDPSATPEPPLTPALSPPGWRGRKNETLAPLAALAGETAALAGETAAPAGETGPPDPDRQSDGAEAFEYWATPVEPGRTLVEASAGTGKTFAIAGLVLRLVLDGDWLAATPGGPPDLRRLLVVTFTRAATDELRTRIRRALRVALAVARGEEIAPMRRR